MKVFIRTASVTGLSDGFVLAHAEDTETAKIGDSAINVLYATIGKARHAAALNEFEVVKDPKVSEHANFLADNLNASACEEIERWCIHCLREYGQAMSIEESEAFANAARSLAALILMQTPKKPKA